MRFAELKAHLLANGDEVGEEHGIDPFVLIFRKDGHKQQIYDIRMLEEQGLDQMIPTEREQAALGFLQSESEGIPTPMAMMRPSASSTSVTSRMSTSGR